MMIDSYPAKGMLTETGDVSRAVGGCVPNVGIDLATIDPELLVSAYGASGADENGDFVRAELSSRRIDISGLAIEEKEPTGFTDVMTVAATGERNFFTKAGANAGFLPDEAFAATLHERHALPCGDRAACQGISSENMIKQAARCCGPLALLLFGVIPVADAGHRASPARAARATALAFFLVADAADDNGNHHGYDHGRNNDRWPMTHMITSYFLIFSILAFSMPSLYLLGRTNRKIKAASARMAHTVKIPKLASPVNRPPS